MPITAAKRMLYPITHLFQHTVRNIEWILGYKINADTLRANELYGLLDFLQEARRCIVKKQVGFIEKENEFRFWRIAYLRELLKQF